MNGEFIKKKLLSFNSRFASICAPWYTASSSNKQHKPNPAVSLATPESKMGLMIMTARDYPMDPARKWCLGCHVVSPLQIKLARSRWIDTGLIFFFFFFNINSGFLVISLHSTVVISIYSIKQLGRTKRELFRNRRDRFIKYRFWNFEVTINFGFSMGAGESVWYNSIS